MKKSMFTRITFTTINAIFGMMMLSVPYAKADILPSSSLSLINTELNNTSWAAKNLIDENSSSRWLSRNQTNDLNFLLDSNGDSVCFASFELTNYGNDDRSVKQFVLLSTADSALRADSGTAGWTPLIANTNPTGKIDYLSWAQGARNVSINSQLNTTTWGAKNINDGSSRSRWLSRRGNNVLEYNFDTDWDGVTGDGIPISEIEVTNYGTDDRSVKELQIEVTTDGSTWRKLEVPGSAAGDLEYVYTRRQDGGVLGLVDSQLNTSSWAAYNMHDGDQNTRWLSRQGNNNIEFTFDPNNNGVTGANGDTSDVFSIEKLYINNYGNDDRSVYEFQVSVKTLTQPTWQKIRVPGAAIGELDYNFALSHHGGTLVTIDSQYNTTSWGADNIHDGDQNTRWLSRKGNNTLSFQFDADENGTRGAAEDLFTLERFYLSNYATDDRSIKQFQVAVKTTTNPNWTKLTVPGAIVGEANYNFALSHHGGTLVGINSQYNTTSWAASNIHDGDQNTRWLSRTGNNTLDFQFDANEDGSLSSGADLFKLERFYIRNYGNDDRSIKQFQVEVKTTSNPNWVKLPVSGSTANTPGYNFVLSEHGGSLTLIDSEYNATTWGADNIHDGDLNTRWLSRKQTNTLAFSFDTDIDGTSGDGINLDTLELVNYGNDDRSIQTFEIDVQVSGGAWQAVNAPGGGTVFTANMDSLGQSWSLPAISDVTAARIRTLSNYGDPYYTGAREIVFSGNTVGVTYTYTAAMHGNGETFTLAASDQPTNVTDVRLRTINNHGDPYYIGAREFELLGPSVTKTKTFVASMHGNGETFNLDASDVYANITDVRLFTINNHGDPYYIGAREFKLLGPSVTETHTFKAAMNSAGETFVLDGDDIPVDVTAVKLSTINNHGDPYYTGLREFEVIGKSVTPAHTFTLPMTSTPYTIALDADDWVSGATGVRVVTIKNHGDPYYTGLSELRLKGDAITPSYIFEAQMNSSVQTFNFPDTNASVLRFHSLNNHGDPYYTGAAEFDLTSGTCNTLEVHYLFDDGAGQTVTDSSGKGRHGILGTSANIEGQDPSWVCESTGFQLDFERASNQRMRAPSFAPPTEGAVAFWMKVPSLPNARNRIFGFGDGYEIRYESDGILYLDINKTGSNASIRTNTPITATDTWMHFAITSNTNDGSWAVYKDGVLDNSGTETLTAQPAAILTVGGSTWQQSGDSFNGSLDDFRIYSGPLTTAEIVTLASTPPQDCSAVDHYEIIHDGSGLTCMAEPITIRACANSDCSILSTQSTSLDFLAEGVTKSSPSFTGTTVVNLSQTTPFVGLTLGIANPSITPTNPLVCNSGSGTSCDIDFSEAGYILSINSGNNIMACDTNNFTIQAVKLSDSGVSCAPAYSGNQPVNFTFNYSNPSSGTRVPVLSGTSMASAGTAQNRTVTFDNNGSATLPFAYHDAGQVSVTVSDAAANGLTPASVTTVASPSKLIVSTPDTNNACVSGDANCSAFKAAGERFNLSIGAACSDNSITPNFEMNNIPLSVNTIAPNLGNPVVLGVNNISVVDADNGIHLESNQTVSEVGVFTITATPPVNGYFGMTIPAGTSDNIGRFIPDHFELVTTFDGVLNGGNPFVYTGQMSLTTPANGQISYSIEPEFTITATSVSGDTTLNYTDSFLKLQAANIVRVTPTQDAIQIGADLTTPVNVTADLGAPNFTGSNGVINYQYNSSDHYVYTREANAIISPFIADIDLEIANITDSDGVEAHDTDSDNTNGVIVLNPSGVEIRFGRWIIENAHGPETVNLPMPMQVQYWNGNSFVLNFFDGFTLFNSATDATITDISLAPATTSASGSGNFILGETSSVILSSPGQNNQGAVTLNFVVPPWLQYDWDNTDNALDGPYDDNPSATATFGVYRGNDRIIYWRELSN